MVAWKAVSKAATWGSAGQASATASMPASAAGLCSGASAASSAIAVRTPASTTTASRNLAPPWTTRCPTASTAGSRCSTARASAACRPGSCSAHDSVPCTATASVAASSTAHLSELEPALSTSTRVMCTSDVLLDRGLRGHPGQADARSASCPRPVADLRHVFQMLLRVRDGLLDQRFQLDDQPRDLRAEARCAAQRLARQVIAAHPIEHDHVEGGGRGALLGEAAHVEALRVDTPMDDLVDRTLVAVEGEDNRLVGGEQLHERRLVHPVGMELGREECHRIHHVH